MFKMTIGTEEFKKQVEKVMTISSDKYLCEDLRSVNMKIDDNVLTLLSTDSTSSLQVITEIVSDTENGEITLTNKDLKLLFKMKGDLCLKETKEGVRVKNGKKVLIIPTVETLDSSQERIDKNSRKVGTLELADFQDGLRKLKPFLSNSDAYPVLRYYNINWGSQRLEALDEYRLGWKHLGGVNQSAGRTFLLSGKTEKVFKKLEKDNPTDILYCFESDSYISIKGTGFTYTQKKVGGQYYNIDNIVQKSEKTRITVNTEKLLDVVKYNANLAKGCHSKKYMYMIFYEDNNVLHTYYSNGRIESTDFIEAEKFKMDGCEYIGFVPKYLEDGLSIMDSEEVEIYGSNELSPWMIEADKYGFFVLPYRVDGNFIKGKIKKLKQVS